MLSAQSWKEMLMRYRRKYRVILKSGEFDDAHYRSQFDGEMPFADSLAHYLTTGAKKGLQPNPNFDPNFYLEQNQDVAAAKVDPLLHFVLIGKQEGRSTWPEVDLTTQKNEECQSPDPIPSNCDTHSGLSDEDIRTLDIISFLQEQDAFDVDYYATQSPALDLEPDQALEHYVRIGSLSGRRPTKDFDPAFYLRYNRDVRLSGQEPFYHYLKYGQAEGRIIASNYLPKDDIGICIETLVEESGLFDELYYRSQASDLRQEDDAVEHYLAKGWRRYLNPGPDFDAIFYTSQHPEIRETDMSPLAHYIYSIRAGGKHPSTFSSTPYHWIANPRRGDDDTRLEQLHHIKFSSQYGLDDELHLPYDILGAIAELNSRSRKPQNPNAVLKASIIIPVYGQTGFALSCLDSLSRQCSQHNFEVVIMDDASPEGSDTEHLGQIKWLRYNRADQNLGFIGACNEGAKLANGDILIFLNSDTRVCVDWLDELLRTFDERPNAGFVGSKLLNGDGTLQEAGAIVWRDGSAWNYGRDDDSNFAQYNFAREVDYCSGAAIAVPRQLWQNVSGFDSHFAPAYYEDVDLAFRIRRHGYEVWYQPLAKVIHFEGKTHGRDETKGVKAYQAKNAEKFAIRWASVLTDHRENGVAPFEESMRNLRRRLLVFDAVTPTPDQDAGSVMTFKLLQIYKKLGWHISFIARHDPRYTARYTADLQRAGVEVFYDPLSPTLDVLAAGRPGFYDAILGFRVYVLTDIYRLLRLYFPSSLLLFHDIDLHHLRLEREANLKNDSFLARKAEVTKDLELELIRNVDCSIVPSSVEKAIIENELRADNVVVYSYTAEPVSSDIGFADRNDLVFIGSYAHSPNVDAMLWFVQKIWPALIDGLNPQARLFVVGANPPQSITSLASKSVVVTGFSQELSPMLEQCRVFVAPLRYGAGLKGKLVTSLSHGLPCVATSIAAEGMGLTDGLNILLADDEATFISKILEIYHNSEKWSSIRREGYKFVEQAYSWEVGAQVASEIIRVAEDTWHRHRRSQRAAQLEATRDHNSG